MAATSFPKDGGPPLTVSPRTAAGPEIVVVVSDGTFGGIQPFGRAILELGARPVLFTAPVGEARLAAFRETYPEVHELETPDDPAALAGRAREVAARGRLTGLFSCFDGLSLPAAHAAAALGLPHPALDGLTAARNKWAMRRALAAAGVPSTPYALLSSVEEISAVAAAVGFPAVIKPLNGTASHLVRRVDGDRELTAAYTDLRRRVADSFPHLYRGPVASPDGSRLDPRRQFLVEALLSGREYTLELIARGRGFERVAIFEKLLVDPSGFLERAFTSPPLHLDPTGSERLWDYTERCLRAAGIADTVVHVEVIDTGDGPRLVEINAGRPAGQILVRAVRDATGCELLLEILALATGRPAPPRPPAPLPGRITTFTVFPPHSGTLAEIDNLAAVGALPGVVDVICYCKPGDYLDVDDKEFFAVNILLAGVEPAALLDLYGRIESLIRFRFSDDPREDGGAGHARS
ncbi:MAG TPA: ATP-grasp domain-containing protein [Thermoanaerobaculia bacterium]|jgi:hypothetical protein